MGTFITIILTILILGSGALALFKHLKGQITGSGCSDCSGCSNISKCKYK